MSTDNAKNEMVLKAQQVQSRYRHDLLHPFPYEDCRKLHKRMPALADGLIPSLDLYFSFIAGYSCGATTLGGRTKDEIRKAIPKLKMSFFDMYPAYKPLEELISATDTPSLHRDLRIADEQRRDLVTIMEHLV